MESFPFGDLPFPARVSIEYQDCQDYGKRSIQQLDLFLDHYFKVYGQSCSIEVRRACHEIQKKKHAFEGENLKGYIDEIAPADLEAWQRLVDNRVIGVTPPCGHHVNVSVEIDGKDYFAKINLSDYSITMFDRHPNEEAFGFIHNHLLQFHMLSYLFSDSCQAAWDQRKQAA